MKKIVFSLFILCCGTSFAQKNDVSFTVGNSIPLSRSSETISIDLKGLVQHHPELSGKELSIIEKNNELVSQLIDNDGNGVNDELIFQSSFLPNETKQFMLHASIIKTKSVKSVVDVRYVLPREDVAWENDRIAFRVYGSVLAGNVDNGIDVWTKRVRYPIVKKWYDGEEQTPQIVYHEDHGEGADFFSVGRSLGAGSAGIVWNGKLLQPGLFTTYRVVTNGPIRVSFELYYPTWKLDTIRVLEIKRMTLDAGQQLNRIDEQFISNASAESLTISAGLVKRVNTVLKRSVDNRRMSLWGLTDKDSINGYLGTAVLVPVSKNVTAQEDSIQYRTTVTVNTKNTFTYFAGASWTRMGDIANENSWVKYLDEFVVRCSAPLIVSFSLPKK